MHRETRITVLITLLFFLSCGLFAQMSDQQVIQELRKYENSGMSQQQILTELQRKGVTTAQLQRLRAQYEEKQNVTDGGVESNYDPSEKSFRDMSEIPVITAQTVQAAPEDRVYGQDFFTAGNLTFSPNMNMPTPANYVLGPGDEVIIDVWGNSELNVRYTITPDGYIVVPGLGRIMLNGLNVQQAESKIRNEFSSIYSDLGSSTPGTFLAISVGNVRTIKVNVMGEVSTPGTYTLSSFASAFHALYVSGGPSRIGSTRNIRIFRAGRNVATVDLYEYLMKGNNTQDINLHDGDIVMVEPYSTLAQITGEIRRPMWYEMREDETLEDLIRFAGGFSGNAYRVNVTLHRKGVNEMEAHTLNQPEYATFKLQDGDRIEVGGILDKYSNMVEITGAIERPGKYAVGDRIKTVRDLVEVALGPTGDAYLQRALLYREQDDLRQSMESFDLEALLNNRIADIPLRKNDRLHIPSIFSLEDSVTVSVGGSVRAPGNYPFALNMRIEDALLRAGGLSEEASTARVDVYRRIKDPSSTTVPRTMSEVYTFTLEEGKIVSSDPTFVLQPFDQIVVRRSPGYEAQENVTISGEILFGGRYAKKARNERLSSLVERAGGLTEYAYPKGARLLRRLTPDEMERGRKALMTRARMEKDSTFVDELDLTVQYVGIDLEKALKRPGGADDIILREGDVLTVPQFNNTVKISGGVMYPNTVTYQKNLKLGGYIRQAGGYSRLAMKSKPFVIYANGKVATGRWARIEPGCEIVVPEKPDREPMSLQGILGISTSIASIALLISNLVK
ncbi:protein involved in polysaccharide export, contains SLBB domain of the beta-grasp fold [Porphyromonadaceae bacterium KH3R12]|nr:protein involved in polysaccharide export, contains SLBB domain of the beta-grasp fold [Porphyromonadaceae bacterium KH3R12]